MHLRGLIVRRFCEFIQVVVDGDFLVMEDVVQIEEILDRDEDAGVHIAVARQEGLELRVCYVGMVKIIQFYDRKVLLCMVELVDVVLQVPLREALSQEQLAGLERLVVDYRQDFFLFGHVIDDFPPNLLVFALSEEHVVHCVEHTGVVE